MNQNEIESQAMAFMRQGELAKAESLFLKVLKQKPKDEHLINNLAYVYAQQNKFEKAQSEYEKLIQLNPGHFNAHRHLSKLFFMQNRFFESIAHAEKSLEINSKAPRVLNIYALSLSALGRLKEAELALREAISIKPTPEYYSNLGSILSKKHAHAQAEKMFRKALEINPDLSVSAANLGYCLLQQGKTREAIPLYEKAISLAPQHALAHRMIASAKNYKKPDDPHIQQMELLLNELADEPLKLSQIHFALGEAYKKCGEFDKSFMHYKQGNEIATHIYPYNPQKSHAFFDQIKTRFSPENIRDLAVKEECVPEPIFIIGMPRSGTSLVEEILGAHKSVYPAGELSYISDLYKSVSKSEAITSEQIKKARLSYLECLCALCDQHRFVTDKMPQNFQYVGFIKMMFPGAKIIHCKRDPRDVCWSMYKLFFPGGLAFSYDFKSMADYYQSYQDLMEFYKDNALKDSYTLSYESLVKNPEQQIRALLDYCELDWDERVLNFYDSERTVVTASALQVKQPIYKTGIASWGAYKDHLEPLFKSLSDCDIEF
jgi:tetratricopeptide (TPR) repeat protein